MQLAILKRQLDEISSTLLSGAIKRNFLFLEDLRKVDIFTPIGSLKVSVLLKWFQYGVMELGKNKKQASYFFLDAVTNAYIVESKTTNCLKLAVLKLGTK